MKPEGFQIRTPMGRVRGLGSARSGTKHFWHERVTSVANIPLTIAFFVIVATVLGRNHAAVVQIVGSPFVAILLLLFIVNSIYHMWLGMQVVIEDYVHDDIPKLTLLMSNTFFCTAAALASVYAILKLSFGV
jgi:succinate dehydrogenase / fumarate reductase, membrane anchor subunit